MSEYKDFGRCVICRSLQNLCEYKGEFEVTMLLDTLYMTLLHCLEKRDSLHVKAREIRNFIDNNHIIKKNNAATSFNTDDYARYLRNGLAHLNVSTKSTRGKISSIKIEAKAQKAVPACDSPCEQQKCIKSKTLLPDTPICEFTFSVKQLEEFTEMVSRMALDEFSKRDECGKSICDNCKHSPKKSAMT